MAPAATLLSMEEYDRQYGHETGWEYRSGVAYRKSVPTFPHGILAALLADLLRLAGYIASVEADVRLGSDWSPRPDVCGVLNPVDGKYPKSVEVVCELLSEKEDILTKCRDYQATGAVGQIFVFDIDAKTIQSWNSIELAPVVNLLLGNGVTITGGRIWREFEERRKTVPPSAMILD